jgi:hydroxymethylbilane synthase
VRLGLTEHATEVLDPQWLLPAVGQGALGLECRADDTPTLALLARLNDAATFQAVTAERSLLRGLGGGCQVPIGAAAIVAGDTLRLRGVVLPPDGTARVPDEITGAAGDAVALGKALARTLLAKGARELLAAGGIVVPESAS